MEHTPSSLVIWLERLDVGCIENITHVNAIQPPLVRINLLVPELSLCCTGVDVKQLVVEDIRCCSVFRLFRLIVPEKYSDDSVSLWKKPG